MLEIVECDINLLSEWGVEDISCIAEKHSKSLKWVGGFETLVERLGRNESDSFWWDSGVESGFRTSSTIGTNSVTYESVIRVHEFSTGKSTTIVWIIMWLGSIIWEKRSTLICSLYSDYERKDMLMEYNISRNKKSMNI